MNKRAIVVGGGVAGIQAALDLGDMGIETFLVEKAPSVGGRMAQLDKTFPTNDCAMCILSPRLVEVASHPYVTILSHAQVTSVKGKAPDFTVQIKKMPRYVDEEKCNGCGVCTTKCPSRIPDPYNKNLTTTSCIHLPFPQAVPAVPVIEKAACRFFRTGKCRICEKFCEAGAIDFNQQEECIELQTCSLILAGGSQEFDARLKSEYGYGLFPNVITSIEFERILSATGPTGGHVSRPSDRREPQRIAILQCVGSRDTQAGNEYCSAICCMQSAKDAIIAHEHLPHLETTIFYIDIRAYGKGFDQFISKAQQEHNTHFVNARVSSVEPADPTTGNLLVRYITPGVNMQAEEFNLVVVSVGMEPSPGLQELLHKLQVQTGPRGFVQTTAFAPVNSSRPGIFTCGSITGPKDIPESVIEASGAASAAGAFQGSLARKEITFAYPPEQDLRGEPPRVGAFICRCGINIAATVDVPQVVAYAATLPGVKVARELLFACAGDSQQLIRDTIAEYKLNRMIVSACTPRTHEPLFRKTLQSAGINPYLFEFANIREQCSWVHQQTPEKATAKAKDLVRDAVSKVLLAEPLSRDSLNLNKAALVIGGGLAGMTAALDLARQGYDVYLLEKSDRLGGNLLHVYCSLSGEPTAPLLADLQADIDALPNIRVYLQAEIETISGYIGNFKTKLQGQQEMIEHGVVIVAIGAVEAQPDKYLLGRDSQVITQRQLEEQLTTTNRSMSHPQTVVMIQCVGSRDEVHPYCSRVCCSTAIKNALKLKALNPQVQIYILYRDIRTYGLRERYYAQAREQKIFFIRFTEDAAPEVTGRDDGLTITFPDPILNIKLEIRPDLLVLSTGIVPDPGNKQISQWLKVPLNADGFFLEAHVKLRPVDFATDGVFVCGLAHNPKDIGETIAQARAAAGRAATILNRDTVATEGKVARVREERCSGCGLCVKACAYNAIEVDIEQQTARVNTALCKGCGVCAASCYAAAVDVRGFTNEQILSVLHNL